MERCTMPKNVCWVLNLMLPSSLLLSLSTSRDTHGLRHGMRISVQNRYGNKCKMFFFFSIFIVQNVVQERAHFIIFGNNNNRIVNILNGAKSVVLQVDFVLRSVCLCKLRPFVFWKIQCAKKKITVYLYIHKVAMSKYCFVITANTPLVYISCNRMTVY